MTVIYIAVVTFSLRTGFCLLSCLLPERIYLVHALGDGKYKVTGYLKARRVTSFMHSLELSF